MGMTKLPQFLESLKMYYIQDSCLRFRTKQDQDLKLLEEQAKKEETLKASYLLSVFFLT
jgi:hypothetical protein